MGYPSVAVLKENGLSVFFIRFRESSCRQTGAGYLLCAPAISILFLTQKLCRNKDTEIVAVLSSPLTPLHTSTLRHFGTSASSVYHKLSVPQAQCSALLSNRRGELKDLPKPSPKGKEQKNSQTPNTQHPTIKTFLNQYP
mgnify:CR=1 FL=1